VTSDRQAELKAAIDRFRPFVGEPIRTPGELAASGLEAIIRLSDQLRKVPHRRKVMVFIGAASVFSPQEPSVFEDRGPSLSERWFDAIRVTARENVSVYAVDPVGFKGGRDDYSESFANETGGQSFSNASNFDAAVGAIWREAGSYYLLGYPAPITIIGCTRWRSG
jgi:hypothetical protein